MTFHYAPRLLLSAVLLAGAVASAAQGKPSSPPTVNVVSTLSNGTTGDTCGTASGALCLQSDGQGSYGFGNGITDYVGGFTQQWALDLSGQSSRVVYLTLNPAGPGSGPTGTAAYNGAVISRCYDASNNSISWFAIAPSFTATNCGLRVNFSSGGVSYTLVMAPGYDGTGRASVQCLAANSSGCSHWSVYPTVSAPNAGVANLYSIGKGGKATYLGAYYLTYRIDVTE